MSKLLLTVLTLSLLTSSVSFAVEDLDPALKDVQELLRSQSKREEVIKGDSKAKQADDFALQAVGGNQKLKGDVYDVSADIMATVQKLSEGDPAKMNALLQKALQNPGEFLKSLPAEQQAKIRDIAAKTEAQKKTVQTSAKP
jgi:hypothetical protein